MPLIEESLCRQTQSMCGHFVVSYEPHVAILCSRAKSTCGHFVVGPLRHFVDLESLSSLTLVGDIVMNNESHRGLLVQDIIMHILKKFLETGGIYCEGAANRNRWNTLHSMCCTANCLHVWNTNQPFSHCHPPPLLGCKHLPSFESTSSSFLEFEL